MPVVVCSGRFEGSIGRTVDGEREDRVAGVGSFVMLSGHYAPAGGGRLHRGCGDSQRLAIPRSMGAGRSSNCSSAGVAHESGVPASGDMAHA